MLVLYLKLLFRRAAGTKLDLLLNPAFLNIPIGHKIRNDYMDYNVDHNAQRS